MVTENRLPSLHIISEDEINDWLAEYDYLDTVSSRDSFVFNKRDPYYLNTGKEETENMWRDILKYHNKPYYPLSSQNKDAETTFQDIRSYTKNAIGKDLYEPPKRLRKLDMELERLLVQLTIIEDKERIKQIKERIKYLEKKLKVRR